MTTSYAFTAEIQGTSKPNAAHVKEAAMPKTKAPYPTMAPLQKLTRPMASSPEKEANFDYQTHTSTTPKPMPSLTITQKHASATPHIPFFQLFILIFFHLLFTLQLGS
jgi:hypothetical protein